MKISYPMGQRTPCFAASHKGAVYYISDEEVIAFNGWTVTERGESVHRKVKRKTDMNRKMRKRQEALGVLDYFPVSDEEFQQIMEAAL